MTDPIVYRPMEPADAKAVSRLILDSFGEFIAGEYSDEGRAEFARYVPPEAIVTPEARIVPVPPRLPPFTVMALEVRALLTSR